jgi:hypothetical protein
MNFVQDVPVITFEARISFYNKFVIKYHFLPQEMNFSQNKLKFCLTSFKEKLTLYCKIRMQNINTDYRQI